MIAVILAGGQGTRLWPMSRKVKPKQFFPILSEQPMILDVYHRLKRILPPEHIFVSTVPELAERVKEVLPELDPNNILVEPCKRDNGPAKAFVAATLLQRGLGDEPFVFVPTDHYIADEQRFLDFLAMGQELVKETNKMVDIAVAPQFPSTNLGYTKVGKLIENRKGIDIFEFAGQNEKPDYHTALKYIESGHYLWHASYLMWTSSRLLEAYSRYAPEIYRGVHEAVKHHENEAMMRQLYQQLPAISIDYAIIEKMDHNDVFILRGDFGWSDIGAWNVLYDRLKMSNNLQEGANVTKGEVIQVDSKNCLVYGHPDKVTAIVGLDNFIVVDTEDALLVCPQNEAHRVKDIIKDLEKRGGIDYL